ncbi:MAG TPA: hypothetical protein VEW66_06015 [Thermomicrobiales bacterium]|nr:hypothetical protein [Thermomicrobiales bacterium]
MLQTTLLLMTTGPEVHGRALGMQALATGIMPLFSLIPGLVAHDIGVSATTQVSGLLLAILLMVLAVRVPELLTSSGDQRSK